MEVWILIRLRGWTTMKAILWDTKNTKLEGGWLLNAYTLFYYGDNWWTVALRQMRSGTVKDRGHTYKFCWIVSLCNQGFKSGTDEKFWVYVVINDELLCRFL
jgi:hypothetical protein